MATHAQQQRGQRSRPNFSHLLHHCESIASLELPWKENTEAEWLFPQEKATQHNYSSST
jgi:hypothetical protein